MPGNGLKGQIKENGKTEVLLGGNQSAIEKVTVIDDTVKGQANRLAEEGKHHCILPKMTRCLV